SSSPAASSRHRSYSSRTLLQVSRRPYRCCLIPRLKPDTNADSTQQHGEEDVAAAAGEGYEGLVVALALGALAVVVGARDGVAEGSERGEEEGAFEHFVAGAVGMLTADGGA